jgi:hypothetical protein
MEHAAIKTPAYTTPGVEEEIHLFALLETGPASLVY